MAHRGPLISPSKDSPLPPNVVVSILRLISVVSAARSSANKLNPIRRFWLAFAALCLLATLGVAGWLRPDPNGFGTHRQLGLPPCTSVWLFGVRCPSCGMTTAWSHAVRGQWRAAVGANAGGALLAAMAMLAGPWMLLAAVRGSWLAGPPGERTLAAVACVLIAATLLDWIYRVGFQG